MIKQTTESKRWPQKLTWSATVIIAACTVALSGAVPFVVHDNKVRKSLWSRTAERISSVCVCMLTLSAVFTVNRGLPKSV